MSAQSLQTLIDQFNDTQNPDARDELLQAIAEHPHEDALTFLKLVAESESEELYTRSDARCALVRRSQGAQGTELLVAQLADFDDAYLYTEACNALADVQATSAVPTLLEDLAKALPEESLHANLFALESLAPQLLMTRLYELLMAARTPEEIRFEAAELFLQAFARTPSAESAARLATYEAHLRTLAAAHPEWQNDLEELADDVFSVRSLG